MSCTGEVKAVQRNLIQVETPAVLPGKVADQWRTHFS